MNEEESLVALASYIPFGPVRIKLLTSFFGSARKVWRADPLQLEQVGLGTILVRGFLAHRQRFDELGYFKRLNKLRIGILLQDTRGYPENLKEIEDAPVVLYVKGKINKLDTKAVAIVGSRKMTDYGRQVADGFSSGLARFGITIVSGLARGVDTRAHTSALNARGRIIAVLASGLDTVYPPENIGLAEKIIAHGALVSEYPVGYPPKPTNFVMRNRIISGLSKAVVVIEGAEKSGTLLTASHAAQQGRTVFAVPGQITSPLSGAPHFLLRSGAAIATSYLDVLEAMDWELTTKRNRKRKGKA